MSFGDSGNDQEMLLKSLGGGFIVSNATDELKLWYEKNR